MDKNEIKAILKNHGYRMISRSWFIGDIEDESVIFNAYDKGGNPYQFYVDWGNRFASMTMFTTHAIAIKPIDVTHMFF